MPQQEHELQSHLRCPASSISKGALTSGSRAAGQGAQIRASNLAGKGTVLSLVACTPEFGVKEHQAVRALLDHNEDSSGNSFLGGVRKLF